MRMFQEWYEYRDDPDRRDWVLRLAMHTIALAHPTRLEPDDAEDGSTPSTSKRTDARDKGQATWLRELEDGKPLRM